MDWFVLLLYACLCFFGYIGSVFLHEAGHALVGQWCRHTVTSFGVGRGQPLVTFSLWGMRSYLCKDLLGGGLTFALQENLGEARWRRALYIAAGPLSNLLVALCLGLGLLWYPDSWPLRILVWINLALFVTSAFPYTMRRGTAILHSDGAQVYRVLKGIDLSPELPQILETHTFMETFLRNNNDTLGAEILRLLRANSWLHFGNEQRAKELLHTVNTAQIKKAPYARWVYEYTHFLLALAVQDLETAQARLEALEAQFQAQGDAAGPQLLQLAELDLLLSQGQFTEARALLTSMLESQEQYPPQLRSDLQSIASRLLRNTEAPTQESPETSKTALNPIHFLLHNTLGQEREEQGDLDGAHEEYRLFVAQMLQLQEQFQTLKHQTEFVRPHRQKLREIRQLCYDRKDWESIHKLQRLLEWNAESSKSKKRQASRTKPSWMRRVFQGLLLFVVVFLATIGYHLLFQKQNKAPYHRRAAFHLEDWKRCQESLKAFKMCQKQRALQYIKGAKKHYNCYHAYIRKAYARPLVGVEKQKRDKLMSRLLDWKLVERWRFYEQRHEARRRRHDLKGALDDLTLAIKLKGAPTPWLLANQARLLVALKQIDEAIAKCDAAIKLSPGSPVVHVRCFRVARRAKRDKAALRYIALAIKNNPTSARLYEQRSNYYIEHKRYADAIKDLKQADRLLTKYLTKNKQGPLSVYMRRNKKRVEAKLKALRKQHPTKSQ